MSSAETAPRPDHEPRIGGADASANEFVDRHRDMANAIRALSMDGVEAASSGHPGLPMGAADIATVLFTRVMRFDAGAPDWYDRDRFVLSAGHGSMLLYSSLHLLGYDGMPVDQLRNFRQLGSATAGHPEFGHAPGIETTTGPLGQGLGNAVGMAIAERHMAARFGSDLIDHNTYVLAGDGCLMEGISHEAIGLAGHLRLSKLIVLFDDNGITIDGSTELSDSTDQLARFSASGWSVRRVDGHDPDDILSALEAARDEDRPSLIACRTTIGFGAPNKQGTAKAHGSPLGADEYAAARASLGIDYEPFDVPADVRDLWRLAGLRGRQARKAWEKQIAALDDERGSELRRRIRAELPQELSSAVTRLKRDLVDSPQTVATRKASEIVLGAVNEAAPELVGGSADLTGSNNTRTPNLGTLTADDYSGRYVHYGIREHGMAAAMNGMALHGGVIPYGGTFLVFSDYSRPAIRLAALMKQRVIHVMTHDSIGLGEDGPTHQPVEHLAALRAIPNLAVFRPADTVETAECWQLAIERSDGPSVLALSRQNLAPVRLEHDDANYCGGGAYEVSPSEGDAQVALFASGSEVVIALEAQSALVARGIATRVVSVPCLDLFQARPEGEREIVVGTAPVKIAVEAGVRMAWDSIIGPDGGFVGMSGFGASGKYQDLYEHFGITATAVVNEAERLLETA